MIDIHAHVLPGIDDGPRDFEQSLALLKSLVADGVEKVVLTPHLYRGHFDNTLQSIEEAFDRFVLQTPHPYRCVLSHFAAEVRFDEHVPALLKAGQLPLLSRKRDFQTVLLEMPDTLIPLGANKLIEFLVSHGVHPVIAHPERNRAVRDNPAKAADLVRMGCYLQLTAGALLGDFGPAVSKTARQLVDSGLISAVASDAHNLTGRGSRMGSAWNYIQQCWGPEAALRLTTSGPRRLSGLD